MNELATRIRARRKTLGLKQREIADHMDKDQSTISHWETGEDSPSTDDLKRLADFFGVPFEALAFGKSDDTPSFLTVNLVGTVAAGEWQEAVELPQDEWRQLPFANDENGLNLPIFALKTMGDSMNLVFPERTILFCAKIIDYDHDLKNHDYVIVYRRRSDGLTEATVKEYIVDEDGNTWLWPRSTSPKHQEPFGMPFDPTGDIEEMWVAAIVIGKQQRFI